MRRWAVALIIVSSVIAGCVEAPQEDEQTNAPVEQPDATAAAVNESAAPEPVLTGQLMATLENLTVNASEAFNVTLEYVGDNASDAAAISWQLALAGDDGNATEYNGTGLPANVTMTIEVAGNYTLSGNATDGSTHVELEPVALSAVVNDPCAGATVQEPITINALFAAVAVDGTGLYQGHAFPVEDCQTVIFVEITSSEAYLDPMLRLKDNTGATVDAEDNEFLYHDTLTYQPGGILPTGNWQIDARGYIGAPGNYEIVISFELPA